MHWQFPRTTLKYARREQLHYAVAREAFEYAPCERAVLRDRLHRRHAQLRADCLSNRETAGNRQDGAPTFELS